MMTEEGQPRLLRVLALVPKDSRLEPAWEPRARRGYIYHGARAGFDEDQLADDLAVLAERGYLERVFVERLMTCPTCQSHAINVHEACVTCNSSSLVSIKSYFHFRCGYIGPEKAFAAEPGGLRCPKCKGLLTDLGTTYDSPGDFFECNSCAAMFQQPQMGARCLGCGALFVGPALNDLPHRDVYAYRLTLKGETAVAKGSAAASDLVES
jgi:hypothetical protein